MKKCLCICLVLFLLISLSACGAKEQTAQIVRTFEKNLDPVGDIWETYYEMSDGTWCTDSHTYQHCLELAGDFAQITVLGNREDISYNEAFMNLGFSSLSTDYFSPEEAVIVRVEFTAVA